MIFERAGEKCGLVRRRVVIQRGDLPGMLFMQFMVQFIDLRSCLVQSFLPGRRDLVDPATMPSNILEDRLQQAAPFQAMQKGIESSRPDAIPVTGEFFHHRQPKDGLVGRMYQDMNPDEAEKEFSLVIGHQSNIPSFLPESNLDSVKSDFDSSHTSDCVVGGRSTDELPPSLVRTGAVLACYADWLPPVGTGASVSNR